MVWVQLGADNKTHVWPCRCPEHIHVHRQPAGFSVQCTWYSPHPSREHALHVARRMAHAMDMAGLSDFDVSLNGEPLAPSAFTA